MKVYYVCGKCWPSQAHRPLQCSAMASYLNMRKLDHSRYGIQISIRRWSFWCDPTYHLKCVNGGSFVATQPTTSLGSNFCTAFTAEMEKSLNGQLHWSAKKIPISHKILYFDERLGPSSPLPLIPNRRTHIVRIQQTNKQHLHWKRLVCFAPQHSENVAQLDCGCNVHRAS